jgi:hypothetical protein
MWICKLRRSRALFHKGLTKSKHARRYKTHRKYYFDILNPKKPYFLLQHWILGSLYMELENSFHL